MLTLGKTGEFTISDNPNVHSARKEEKQCKEIGGFSFDVRTPDDVCNLLVALHKTRQRVVLVYGDVETGKAWESATPERGRIGRSTGMRPIPLLVRTARSLGGEAVISDCILQVRDSVGGRVIYSRKVG